MSQDTGRLSDALVANLATYAADVGSTTREVESLAREVQASRKLVADLRGVHRHMRCCELKPCHTITMIDEAGL